MSVKVNVYLNFNGNCKDAFGFYEKAFRTQIAYSCTYGQQEEMSAVIKEEDKNKIMHCYLPVAPDTAIMGSDVVEGEGCSDSKLVEGNNVVMTLAPDSEEEAKRLYNELSAGGKIITPLEKSFWNSLYALFTDKFGINWIIDYSYEEK